MVLIPFSLARKCQFAVAPDMFLLMVFDEIAFSHEYATENRSGLVKDPGVVRTELEFVKERRLGGVYREGVLPGVRGDRDIFFVEQINR